MNKRIAVIGLLGIISFLLSFTFVRDALIDDKPLFPTLEDPGYHTLLPPSMTMFCPVM